MKKRKLTPVFVVEGRSDTTNLQKYYEVDTFETSGTGFNEKLQSQLLELSKHREIVIFTDPDMPGEMIRREVVKLVPTAQHAFVHALDAKSSNNKKVGIEHVSKAVLDEALARIKQPELNEEFVSYTETDMVDLQLIADSHARARRDYVTQKIPIGRVNGKQFLKRLNMFQIDREILTEIIAQFDASKE